MYNIIYETSYQSRFYARYWMLGAGALGWPRGMVWRGRKEEGSGWGTHVCLWRIHFDIWQNLYNIVKFKNKIKFKKMQLNSPHPVSCSIQFLLPKAGCQGEGKDLTERSNHWGPQQKDPSWHSHQTANFLSNIAFRMWTMYRCLLKGKKQRQVLSSLIFSYII